MRRVHLFIVCMLCRIIGFTQPLAFTHLTTENGITQNSVMSICQDAYGFMWFGTSYGLNKYDGHTIRTYKNANPQSHLSNTFITSLCRDAQKILWVGTRNGLNIYNPLQDNFSQIFFKAEKGDTTGINNINIVLEDSRHNIWVGTSNGLQLLTNRKTNTFKRFHQPGLERGAVSADIRTLFEDSNGYLWIGTSQGLLKTIFTGNEIKVLEIFSAAANGLKNDYITSITEDAYKKIWIGTRSSGIYTYRPGIGIETFIIKPNSFAGLNNIRKLLFINNKSIWAGTLDGLLEIDPLTREYAVHRYDEVDTKSLSNNSVHSIYKDDQENIWIGTYYGGANFFDTRIPIFKVHKKEKEHNPGINHDVVISLAEDENENLWIGTAGSGLNQYNLRTGKFVYYQNSAGDDESISSDIITVVYKDKVNRIWAGTYGGGLNLYVPDSKKFRHFFYKKNDAATLSSEITSLLQDNSEKYWVGFHEGLGIYSFRNNAFEPADIKIPLFLQNKIIRSLYEDRNKNVWICTSQGLFILKSNSKTFTQIQCPGVSATQYVNCLMQDSKGNIWLGLFGEGMALYDMEKNTVQSFTVKDGLCNDNVLDIKEDNNNNLWIITDNGLSRFNPSIKSFRTYTANDGLAGNVFNYHAFVKTINDEMFLGGVGGLTNFYPAAINNSPVTAAPVTITRLHLFNEEVGINDKNKILSKDIFFTEKISLAHSQNVFSIDFSLLNFIAPEKNRYAYKLDGIDRDWNYTTTNSATYNNLTAGNYRFSVKGAGSDGAWSKPATLEIEVLPPVWKTWWAYLLYVAFLLAIIYLVVRFIFTRALLRKDSMHTQLKLNFFTNISHEIRTHLSLIHGPVEKLMLSKRADEQDQLLLQTIRKNSGSLLQLVNELMDFRKAETGNLPLTVSNYNIVDFIRSVHASFLDMSISRNINLQVIASSENIEVYFDKEQLEKVLYNLLSNAFKFTTAGGNILIYVNDDNASVEIKVVDDGKGISAENIDKLFDNYFQEADYGKQNTGYGIGLALSKSIVELHHGTLLAKSEVGKSAQRNMTSFTVLLAKGKSHFDNVKMEYGIPEKESALFSPPAISIIENTSVENPTGTTSSPDNETRKTVLIVEDNQGIRNFIKDALQKDYNIRETANGTAGWQEAIELIPDLIISDIMMPEMDGMELCSKLKNDIRTSHIPVILLTAKSGIPNHVAGLQTGADIYLTKPFSIQVLALQVYNLLTLASRASTYLSNKNNLQLIEPISENTGGFVEEPAVKLNPLDEEFLTRVIQIVEANMEDPDFNIDILTKKVAMSKPILYKKLKAITGLSVNDFLKSIRLRKAAQLLIENRHTVYEVAYLVGYQDSRYFSREFTKQFGVKPSEYSKNN